ncbi:MAG: transcriptional regulator GcvA [Cellvibrionaceae bacterium]
MRLPPLNAIRAFEACARHLSFKNAAEELFVTPAAISYQIKILEEFLGVDLFIRENRLILLTPAGQRCFNDVKNGFELIARGIEKAQADQKSGALTVSAGPAFTVKWLAPRLHLFVDEHPDIDARVSAGLSFADLRHDNIDAAIRFGNAADDDLYIEELIREVALPLCHPDLLTGEYALTHPAALKHHTLIHDDSLIFNPKAPTWKTCLAKAKIGDINPDKGLRFNQADHALQAAIDGSGVILARRVLALPDIRAGRLVIPFPEWELDTKMYYYFACLKEKAEQYKVKAFKEWIKSELLA